MKLFRFTIRKQIILVILAFLITVVLEWLAIYKDVFNIGENTNPYAAYYIATRRTINPFIYKRLQNQKKDLYNITLEFINLMQKLDNDYFLGSDAQLRANKLDFYDYLTGYFIGTIELFDNTFDFNKYDGYRVRLLSDSGEVLSDSIDIDHSGFREDIFRKASALSDSQYNEMLNEWINNDEYFTGHDYYDSIFYPYKQYNGQEIIDAKNNGYGAKIRYSFDYNTLAVLYSAMPLYIDGNISGFVLFSQNFYSLPTNYLEWIWVLLDFCLLSFIIAIPLVFILIRRLVNPLSKLSKQTKTIIDKKGRILQTELFASKRKDEIGDLSRSFSTLISRINDRIHYVETFSSDVAHEFKNPLAAIRSSVDIMNDPDLNSKDKQELYKSINEEIHHLEVLLNDIRNISKIENQNDEEGKENVPVGLFTENILKRIKTNYDTVTFDFNCENQNKVYFIKPENLDRLLENLIDNAASFAVKSEQKKVSVSIESIIEKDGKETMTIAVEDSGTGVPAGEEEKIFERFYTHREDEQKKDHSGLGLSTVKAIVDSLNGKIAVAKSEDLDGAKFLIELP